jgi:hypothetical protein
MGAWRILSAFFLLTFARGWTIPLQYVNAGIMVLLFRMADPFRFWKVEQLFLLRESQARIDPD